MANEFVAKNGLISQNNTTITGSLIHGLAGNIATGEYSHAEGSITKAIGDYSHAEGDFTEASGDYSHAEGQNTMTLASAQYSHAEGNNTIAAANYQHVQGEWNATSSIAAAFIVGNGTDDSNRSNLIHAAGSEVQISGSLSQGSAVTASGAYSHAEGQQTQAYGEYSHAEGRDTIASGSYSHAEGQNTIAPGSYSHAEGDSAKAIGDYSHAEGDLTQAKGERSHVEGNRTIASGSHSHAEGYLTIAIGVSSHAEGKDTQAIGNYSHAEGDTTIAQGLASHAEGLLTLALGLNSHAEGLLTTASANYSHAEGQQTQAIGEASHTEGLGTVSSGSYQHVQGQYNISSSVQSAFIIGNGTSGNNRSNLVFAAGNTFQITGSLNVSNGITGSLQGTASWANNAITASYALFAANGGGTPIDTSSFATTGSNTFNGNQIITGSLIVTGSSFITGPVDLISYTAINSFTGSAIASLAADSAGNIITTGFPDPLKAFQAAGSNIKAMPVGLWPGNFSPAVAAQTSQTLRLNAVYLPTNETITGVRWYQAALQSGATPSNYNGFGLYTLSGTTLTCQVSSSNSNTIWSGGSANNYNSISFDTPYIASAGLYYIGFLLSTSAPGTQPTFGISVAISAANQLIPGLTTNNKLTAAITLQTSMPTSIAMSTLAASQTFLNVCLF